jgi:hypothetical protein
MKTTILGLLAATLVATPALASWKSEMFGRLDTDANGLLSVAEIETTGCKVNTKFFAYADVDRNRALSKQEFYNNRDLFRRCK